MWTSKPYFRYDDYVGMLPVKEAAMEGDYLLAKDELLAVAKADEKVAAETEGKTIVKELYVKGRLVNIVVK